MRVLRRLEGWDIDQARLEFESATRSLEVHVDREAAMERRDFRALEETVEGAAQKARAFGLVVTHAVVSTIVTG
jgi:hypothetical protein